MSPGPLHGAGFLPRKHSGPTGTGWPGHSVRGFHGGMNSSPLPPHEPHPDPPPDHDRGLGFDLFTLMSRRSLGLFLGAGTAEALAACTPGPPAPDAISSSGTAPASSAPAAAPSTAPAATPALTRAIAECGVEIPRETAGPYPGRLPRAQRAGSLRDYPAGHFLQFWDLHLQGHRRASYGPADPARQRERLHAAGRRGRLRLALRQGRPVLPVRFRPPG